MKPEKVFRIGLVCASVFANDHKTDSGTKKIRNVHLHRRYRDGEEWKTSTTFSLAELPQAATALDLALKYVTDMEAVVELN